MNSTARAWAHGQRTLEGKLRQAGRLRAQGTGQHGTALLQNLATALTALWQGVLLRSSKVLSMSFIMKSGCGT